MGGGAGGEGRRIGDAGARRTGSGGPYDAGRVAGGRVARALTEKEGNETEPEERKEDALRVLSPRAQLGHDRC